MVVYITSESNILPSLQRSVSWSRCVQSMLLLSYTLYYSLEPCPISKRQYKSLKANYSEFFLISYYEAVTLVYL